MPHVSSRPRALGILLMSPTCPPLLCFTLLFRAAREELKERSPAADVGKVFHIGSHQGPSIQDGTAVSLTNQLAMRPGVPLTPLLWEGSEQEKRGSHPVTAGYRLLLFQAHRGGGI